jgi:hypothetical protein
MKNIRIIDKVYTTTIRECDSEDCWDRDDTSMDHDIIGFVVKEEKDYGDISVNFDPKYDKEYYLLSVIYDTGDSFGRDEGQIEFIDLYENLAIAEENSRRIREDESDKYSVKLLHETGKEYDVHTPWKGYFEDLRGVEIDQVFRKVTDE